jgi:hypothetical protein
LKYWLRLRDEGASATKNWLRLRDLAAWKPSDIEPKKVLNTTSYPDVIVHPLQPSDPLQSERRPGKFGEVCHDLAKEKSDPPLS